MLKKNQDVKLNITGYTSEGYGVGKAEGMAVFVPEGIEGETVLAHIIKVNRNFAVGKLIEVITPSGHRIEPKCPYFHKCGGCVFMHMDYAEELKQKQKRVSDAFRRLGGFDIEAEETVLSPDELYYRNKAQFPAGMAEGKPVFGFFSTHSHRVVPVEGCLLLPTEISALHKAAQEWMQEYDIPVYNEETKTGLIRHLFIRMGKHSLEAQVCIIASKRELPFANELISSLKKAYSGLVSVILNVNTDRINKILSRENITLWGKDTITDTMCGKAYEISPNSFYQVNTLQAEQVYCKAADLACENERGNVLVDLYCGAGTIGLSMANRFDTLIGVEIVPEAIENARKNAEANGITNARFICADAAKAAEQLKEEGITPDVVIVDPPRKGCDTSLIDTLAAMSPRRIVYVSCDPATAARDAKLLCEKGYTLTTVKPYDMFPRTGHVESVVCLTRSHNDVI